MFWQDSRVESYQKFLSDITLLFVIFTFSDVNVGRLGQADPRFGFIDVYAEREGKPGADRLRRESFLIWKLPWMV